MLNNSGNVVNFSVSSVKREELSAIAELEKLCFSEPWSEESLTLLLGDKATGFVATEANGRLVGYVGLVSVLDEGQITNIATHPDYRRKGIGKALMERIFEYCKEKGICYLSLEVRDSNKGAIALYESFGFKTVGIRKNFYRFPVEDARVMTAELN
ncbi:MAG: ribosomal protein S18-alanine N-acetyltransferase [Clostridia bacterium]|nr:ribosomal protein S18-alanine N-acetyltransferase [Clostridia bacterium]